MGNCRYSFFIKKNNYNDFINTYLILLGGYHDDHHGYGHKHGERKILFFVLNFKMFILNFLNMI